MSEKSDELVNELVSAAIAFGRGQLPDWQTRIEKARVALREYIEGMEPRWIPVSERLPEENAPVLVLTVLGGMFVDFIYGKSVVTGNPDFYELDIEDVTHWMPLPTPPEVK